MWLVEQTRTFSSAPWWSTRDNSASETDPRGSLPGAKKLGRGPNRPGKSASAASHDGRRDSLCPSLQEPSPKFSRAPLWRREALVLHGRVNNYSRRTITRARPRTHKRREPHRRSSTPGASSGFPGSAPRRKYRPEPPSPLAPRAGPCRARQLGRFGLRGRRGASETPNESSRLDDARPERLPDGLRRRERARLGWVQPVGLHVLVVPSGKRLAKVEPVARHGARRALGFDQRA